MRNIKNQCVDLFSSLIEIFGDDAIANILKVIETLLTNQKQMDDIGVDIYMSTNQNHKYKRIDAGMLLLGLFVEDIQMFTLRHP